MIHRRAAAAGRQHEHETQRDLDAVAVTDAEGERELVIFALKLCSFRHRPDHLNPNPVLESPQCCFACLRTRHWS